MSTLFRQFAFTPETIKEVRDAVASGADISVTERYPIIDGENEVHGCILGKGKDVRVWVSQRLFDEASPPPKASAK